jgi:hypothetical protein
MLFGLSRPATIIHAKPGIVWLRVISSLAWLDSAFIGAHAKVAPAFIHGDVLAAQITTTFVHTAIDARVAQMLVGDVGPHAAFFALLIAGADAATGISLALGCCVRLASAVAIARALTNILVAAGAGVDTIGYNAMLITAAAICMATAAGRATGIDARLINRFPRAGALRLIA